MRRTIMILFMVLVGIASVASAQNYTVTDLGVLSGDSASEGLEINNSGLVVGCSDTSDITTYPCSSSFPGQAFVWSLKSGMQGIGVLSGGVFSEAYSITDTGLAVGYSLDSQGVSTPFVWTKSAGMSALPTFSGATYSFAGQANVKGAIAGSSNSGANPSVILPVAWIKSGNAYKLLTLPTLSGAVISLCCSINNSDEGAGVAFLDYTGTNYHAFRVKATGAVDLGTLPGGTISNGIWINSSGVVAGYSNSSASGSNWIAVAWDPSKKIHSLGTLPGGTSSAGNGINDSNQIVGFSSTATSTSDAMIWTQKGGMQDLNNMIAADSGWVLEVANSINNSGQITGYGTINGESHAFLLTPQ